MLLDSGHRRSALLEKAVERLGWSSRVRVVCERAEEAGRCPGLRASQALVVARSFGSPAVTAECAAGFLRTGGFLVVSEPPSVVGRVAPSPGGSGRWPPEALLELGLVPVARRASDFTYQVLRQEMPCPERYPRRTGVPAKRPLYS